MHSEAEYRIAADLRDNVMRGDTPTGGDTCGPLHREWQAASAGSSPLAPQGHALSCCDAVSPACVIPLSYQIPHKISNCLSLTFTLGSAPLRHPRVNIGKSKFDDLSGVTYYSQTVYYQFSFYINSSKTHELTRNKPIFGLCNCVNFRVNVQFLYLLF